MITRQVLVELDVFRLVGIFRTGEQIVSNIPPCKNYTHKIIPMNFVDQPSQPAPTIHPRSSRIIAVLSVVIILLLIIAFIFCCAKSFSVDIIDSPIVILFILGYILCISSIVNMYSQQVHLALRRINQYAICIPHAILAIVLLTGYIINVFFEEQVGRQQRYCTQ